MSDPADTLFASTTRAILIFLFIFIALISPSNAANLLCGTDWTEISGPWNYDGTTCSLTGSSAGCGNNVWFGSSDGLLAGANYQHSSFLFRTVMEITNGTWFAGVQFRATQASAINDQGPDYFVGLNAGFNRIVFGVQDNGFTELQLVENVSIEYNTTYVLEIKADANYYNVSLNDTQVITNLYDTTLSTTGSIALSVCGADAFYHSIEYQPLSKSLIAEVNVVYDNYGSIFSSSDNGMTWSTVASVPGSTWLNGVFTINVDVPSLLLFSVVDAGTTGGFIATIKYDGMSYSTSDPITNSLFQVASSSDGITSPLVYSAKTGAPWYMNFPQIADDAKWIWNGRDSNTMVFEFDFSSLMTTQSPTSAPTISPTFHGTTSVTVSETTLDNSCLVETINIVDNVEIQLDLTMNSWTTGNWIHMFDIGTTSSLDQYMAMRYNGYNGDNFMYFAILPDQTWEADPSFTPATGVTVHHEIFLTQSTFVWKMDGVIVMNTTANPHDYRSDALICFPCITNGDSQTADGRINNFRVRTYTNEPTPAPTFSPTQSPTLNPTQSPTLSPTDSPSSTPTSAPSYSPSQSPSKSPTPGTDSPTMAPSQSPTDSPSLSPSNAPSIAPSESPTNSPSNAPTRSPSAAPSHSPSAVPSNAPSLAPTASPTACIDYKISYNSSDGKDRYWWKSDPQNSESFPVDSQQVVDLYVADLDQKTTLYAESIACNNTIDADACFIGCYFAGLCVDMIVQPSTGSIVRVINISCVAARSCRRMVVNIPATAIAINEVYIKCSGQAACEYANITVHSSIDIRVECEGRWACRALALYLMSYVDEDNDADHDMHAKILCYDDYSCNELFIDSYESKRIFVDLTMYRFSDEIFIHHRYWKQVQVECFRALEDRYIRYETLPLPDTDELLFLAQREYASTQRLPCDDIIIECSNSSEFEQLSCEYQYDVVPYVNLTNILSDERVDECYWIPVDKLFRSFCNGNCDDYNIYYDHNVSFAVDIIFGSEESVQRRLLSVTNETNTNTTLSYRKCIEYWGTENATLDSLETIDAIFSDILSLISGEVGDVFRDVLRFPYTELRENVTCENSATNTMRISTDLTVKSIERSQAKVDAVFDVDAEFLMKSLHLISLAFGVPVSFEAVRYDNTPSPPDVSILWEVIVPIVIVCMCIVAGILYYRHRKRNQLTLWIRNPMVIVIGIGFYEKARQCPNSEVEGYLLDLLDGVRVDIDNIRKFCDERLKYDLYPKCFQNEDKGTYKAVWTKDELLAFLKQKAADFSQSVHDSLILFLSCHGLRDDIITTDRRLIKKSEIHRIFSMDPVNRKKPRVCVFDCCAGDKDRVEMTRERYNTLTAADDDSDDEEEETKSPRAEDNTQSKTKEKKIPMLEDHESVLWATGEVNPDYQLALIEGANEGFQSKLDQQNGSFLTTTLVQMLTHNIYDKKNEKFLHEICEQTQAKLHNQDGLQLVQMRFFNETGYIRFGGNTTSTGREEASEVQLAEIIATKRTMDSDAKMPSTVTKSTGDAANSQEKQGETVC